MGLASDVFADLIEMQLHRVCIGLGQDQSRTGATLGADGAKQVSALIALIGWQARPGSLLRPDAHPSVLLANARFILEPYLDRCFCRQIGYVRGERVGEVFLNASITRASCCGCCGRPEILENPSAAR